MKIDWHGKATPTGVNAAASLLRSSGGGKPSGGLEGMLEMPVTAETAGAGGVKAGESQRLERLGEALAKAKPAVPEGEQTDLKEKVLAGASSGLAKVYQGEPSAQFTLGEHIGLEAVILTNGERPSLFVRDGFVDLKAPDIGNWDEDLGRAKNGIRKVTASVGRIDVPVKPWFAGTCFVIAQGLVLTNRHVLEEIAIQAADGAWKLNWPDATTANFAGEDGVNVATKFKVIGVAFAGPDAINRTIDFAHLDMAILQVDPASNQGIAFPEPVTFETDISQPKAPSGSLRCWLSGRAQDLAVRRKAAGRTRDRTGHLDPFQQQVWRQTPRAGHRQGGARRGRRRRQELDLYARRFHARWQFRFLHRRPKRRRLPHRGPALRGRQPRAELGARGGAVA